MNRKISSADTMASARAVTYRTRQNATYYYEKSICTRAKPHCSDSFVKRRENMLVSDRCRHAMPVHVGSQVWIDTCKGRLDPLAAQMLEQIKQGSRGRIINIRDGACVDDEPSDRRRRVLQESTHFVGETIFVRVKQVCAEVIDDQAWFRL